MGSLNTYIFVGLVYYLEVLIIYHVQHLFLAERTDF